MACNYTTKQGRSRTVFTRSSRSLFVFFSLSVSEVGTKKEKARHISRARPHSKQREEVLQVANLERSAHFNTTGNMLYCINPPESPPFPASAPREMNHPGSVRCATNNSSVPGLCHRTAAGVKCRKCSRRLKSHESCTVSVILAGAERAGTFLRAPLRSRRHVRRRLITAGEERSHEEGSSQRGEEREEWEQEGMCEVGQMWDAV